MRRSLINEKALKPIKYKAEPTISCFHYSTAFVRGIRGPIGSGKTVGCCWEVFKKGLEQKPFNKVRSTRWALIRNTYSELKTTTVKTWLDWFDGYTKIVYSKPIEALCSLTLKDGTTVRIELFFIALDRPDDVRKLKGLELTGAYLNEMCEIDYAVLDMVTGRVGRYPPKFKGGFTWHGVIGDTNSMDDDHWYYRVSEENIPETWEFFTQPPALLRVEEKDAHKIPKGEPTVSIREGKVIYIYYPNPAAENYEGQTIGVNYWLKMIPGKAQNWINIFILNKYGTITTGRPVYPEYDDDVHCTKENIIPSKKFGLIFGWDWGLCYSDDTEVLTLKGWKMFKDVDEDADLVATRNPATGELTYTAINFKIEREYEGEMLEWSGQGVDFCVTPEHRVPFTYRDTPNTIHFKSAKWLEQHAEGHHYVNLTSAWAGTIPEKVPGGLSPKVFMELMGWILSDGTIDRKYNRLSIAQKKPKYIKKLETVLKETGLEWKKYKNCISYECRNKEISDYLRNIGTKAERSIPEDIKAMPPDLIRMFIKTYTMGDGNVRIRKNGSKEHRLYVPTKRLGNDMQEMAQKVGWNSSMRVHKGQTSILNGRKIISKDGYLITFKKRAKKAELLKSNFRRIKYKGKIYCLNVPYHTLYIRRNGRPSWNGNTPAFAVMQLSNNRLDVIEEIYIPSHAGMGVRQFITQVIRPHVLKSYKWWIEKRLIQSGGDPAGTIRSQTDEVTCINVANSIFEKEHITTVSAFTNAILARLDAVQRFLIDFPDGNPAFRLSPKCKHLRKGFRGRWVYERIQASGRERYRDKPDKTTYSHIQEAVQYGAMIAYEQAYGEKPKLSKYDKRIDELEKTAKNDHVTWASKAQQAAVRDLTRQDLIETISGQ